MNNSELVEDIVIDMIHNPHHSELSPFDWMELFVELYEQEIKRPLTPSETDTLEEKAWKCLWKHLDAHVDVGHFQHERFPPHLLKKMKDC